MKDIEQLEQEKQTIIDERQKVIDGFDFEHKSLEEWEEELEPFNQKVSRLIFLIESQTDVEWEDLPSYGDLMTKESWLECVNGGGFIDYDGSGNYSDGERMSNKSVSPSDVDADQIMKNEEFTHIVWFNR